MVQDRGSLGHEGLSKAIDQLLGLARRTRASPASG